MQLAERIYLVGSGSFGFDLTDAYDCHVYLVDGGAELALVDVGAGMGAAQIVANVERCGFDPARVTKLLCTHAHGDHAGGAARMRELLPNASLSLSKEGAVVIRAGDERAASLDVAKVAGIYPADYRLEPCAVDEELGEGDRVALGDLVLECVDTPGHSNGHLSFLLEHGGRRSLFGGNVDACATQAFVQLGVATFVAGGDDDDRGSFAGLRWADELEAAVPEPVDQLLNERLVVRGDRVESAFDQILERSRPRQEVEEVGRPEDVVGAGAEIVAQRRVAFAIEVERGSVGPGEPVR